jgi:hypothetical protein
MLWGDAMQDWLEPGNLSRSERLQRRLAGLTQRPFPGSATGAVQGQGFAKRVITFVAVGVPLLIGIVFIIVSFATRSEAALSSFVQAHGVRREAVILNVQNEEHHSTTTTGSGSSRHTTTSTSWTALVQVSLADPVGGQTRTTVHVPGYESASPGDSLTVLVNPNDPTYAELPGSPSTSPLLPTIFLVVGSVMAVLGIALWVLIARKGGAFLNRSWQWNWSSRTR